MKKKLLLSLTALVASTIGIPGSAQNGEAENDLYVPGALYVQFKSGTLNMPKSSLRQVPVSTLFPSTKDRTNPYGLHPYAFCFRMGDDATLSNTFRIDMDSLTRFEDLIEALENDPRIRLVERVPLRKIQAMPVPADSGAKTDSVPNDRYYGTVGGINTSWHLDMVGFPETYGKYTGDPSIRVAVVDNAVWGAHPDLQIDSANMYDASTETYGNSAPPSNVWQNQPGTINDPSQAYIWSHGTHCAGLIGAIANNGTGIASIGSGVTLMGIKAAAGQYADALPNAMEGCIHAVENGADVISMSFGAEGYSATEALLYEAMVRKGIILLAAAGNDGKTDVPNYPADFKGVISVGSVNSDGNISSFSNRGNWVDIWSPGGYIVENDAENTNVQILSTTYCHSNFYSNNIEFMGECYDAMAGTSMATPLAAGVVSLILSYFPDLNGYQMAELLQKTSKNGIIHAPSALEYMENLDGRQVTGLQARCNPSSRLARLEWNAPQDASVDGYTILLDGDSIGHTRDLSFEWSLSDSTWASDSTALVGLAAIYGNMAELPVYTRFVMDEHLANEAEVFRSEPLHVYVDHAAKTVRLPQGFEFEHLEIYNVQGALMRSVPAGTTLLDMSGCASGMYIGRAFRDGMAVPFKFVL